MTKMTLRIVDTQADPMEAQGGKGEIQEPHGSGEGQRQ